MSNLSRRLARTLLQRQRSLQRSILPATMSTAGLAFDQAGDHIQNELWTKVDHYTLGHIHPSTRPNTEALRNTLKTSRANDLPDISTDPNFAKFMALQCKGRNIKHALELGTLGGYGSIWLATENPDLKITTVEIDPLHKKVAEANYRFAGVDDRVTVRLGPGLEILPQVGKEIEAGKLPKFGFVYLDADKNNNWNYINMVISMCEPGALIFVDNMLQGGDLVNPKSRSASTLGARSVVENVGKDDRLDAVVMQTVGEKSYDAFLMAVVK